jgi:hypothetical protein
MQGVISEKDQMWSFSIVSGRSDETSDRVGTPHPTVGLLRRWAATSGGKDPLSTQNAK